MLFTACAFWMVGQIVVRVGSYVGGLVDGHGVAVGGFEGQAEFTELILEG
jgi:hypothetical protein